MFPRKIVQEQYLRNQVGTFRYWRGDYVPLIPPKRGGVCPVKKAKTRRASSPAIKRPLFYTHDV
jgi:hypothetical protein